jgi:hypothetical protein
MGCMATHPQPADPVDVPVAPMTGALDAKLAELRGRGFEIAWIESCRGDLTRLVMEGGEAAIRLDADPSVDRAWYGDVEIRHASTSDQTWVFVRGEVATGEISSHQVDPAP